MVQSMNAVEIEEAVSQLAEGPSNRRDSHSLSSKPLVIEKRLLNG